MLDTKRAHHHAANQPYRLKAERMNVHEQVMVARRRTLPGFGLTMGYSVFYLSLVVLIPLTALIFNSTGLTWSTLIETASNPGCLLLSRLAS